jgi:hypothetical protein
MNTRVDVNYSIYHRTFKFTLDGVNYDLSNFVPDEVWGLAKGIFPVHPIADWKIRVKLKEIFLLHFYDKDLDELIDPDSIDWLN